MLVAAHRLRHRGDFATVVRSGRRVGRGGTLVVHLLPGDPHRPARVGFVVSRAVGGAVTRNVVRRRLRHLVRDRLGSLPAGALVVVRALPPAADAAYSRLGADLDAALDSLLVSRSGSASPRRPAAPPGRGGRPEVT